MSRDLVWPRIRRKVLGKKGLICHWCGRRLINFSDIPDKKRIKVQKHKVVWRASGKIKEGWLATIDHVMPSSLGGSDELTNLVPSCHECNNVRGRFSDPSFRSRKNGRKVAFIVSCWTNRIRKYQMSKIAPGGKDPCEVEGRSDRLR